MAKDHEAEAGRLAEVDLNPETATTFEHVGLLVDAGAQTL